MGVFFYDLLRTSRRGRVVGLMAYAGLAGVLWRLARARFSREAERAVIV
jgi:hypothetical protein